MFVNIANRFADSFYTTTLLLGIRSLSNLGMVQKGKGIKRQSPMSGDERAERTLNG